MSILADRVLVGAMVLLAVWYAAVTFGPRAWRRGATVRGAGACGGCDNCATTKSEPCGAAQSGAETRVPLAQIAHRPRAPNPPLR